jgi:hypothetical protein
MMRLHLHIIAAAVLLLGIQQASAAPAESVEALLDPYFRIQSQLTDDKTDGLKSDAELVAKAAASLGTAGESIVSAAQQLAQAATLGSAREAFGALSAAVIGYAESTRTATAGDVKKAYCPMLKKSWLQKGEKIRNPYLGKQMPDCGEIKKKTAA